MDSLCTGWTHLAQAPRGLYSLGEAWTAFAQDGHILHRLIDVCVLGKAWTAFSLDGHI